MFSSLASSPSCFPMNKFLVSRIMVAQSEKDPSALQENWVRCLGQEDLLEEGMETHSSVLAWSIPMGRGA